MGRWLPGMLFAAAMLGGCATGGVPAPDAPTIVEIIEASRAGNGDAVIRRIIASDAVYRLPASELARLRDHGVTDAVIDAMQWSYLESVRREEAFRQFQIQQSASGCRLSRFRCSGYLPWPP